jgi:cellulose synthase/poly-beta-1,6-N-acetylglucosamine synthase-like glycosyltransferase
MASVPAPQGPPSGKAAHTRHPRRDAASPDPQRPPPRHDPRWVAAIIPAFNESKLIGAVIRAIRRHVDTVLVVDDGSTDGTAEAARAAGAEVVSHAARSGKGVAIRTGSRG